MKEQKIPEEKHPRFPHPVVGIGSSAGGVEALQTLFSALPSGLKAAFILVQHLQPDRPSMLADIIRRTAHMPVTEAEDGMKIEPGNAYMIPPGKFLSLQDGVLILSAPAHDRVHLPVDFLFRSIAKEMGEASIGVVLSGTGSDGTLGLREIHGAGGITIVQEPKSAQYGQMPENAINTGVIDHVTAPEKIGQLLDRYILRLPAGDAFPEKVEPVATRILALLNTSTSHDFSSYKTATVLRRIARRMSVLNIHDPEKYIEYMNEHREEAHALFRELLIRVTSFFRDPDAFKMLAEDILPKFFAKRQDEQTVRIWVAGCSTGEEAYSIAMLFEEFKDAHESRFNLQVFATDLDEPSVDVARSGFYPLDIVADVSEERLRRFFTIDEHGYRIKKELREKIVFAVQNLLRDPPFRKLDLVSCRNLLIYLQPEAQKRLLETFHYSLVPGGILFLGSSETMGGRSDLFEVIGNKWKFCVTKPRKGYTVLPMDAGMRTYGRRPAHEEGQSKELLVKEAARNEIIGHFSPPSVIVDELGTVVLINGQVGRFLELVPGGPRFNIYNMAKKGLRSAIHATLHKAISKKEEAVSSASVISLEKERINTRVRAKPLSGIDGLFIVVFEELVQPKEPSGGDRREPVNDKRVTELEEELARMRDDFQGTIEELQTSIEEQRSTSEELQSSNEELQSTNEELETSKEELQSINEELVTVNAELEERLTQLNRAESDIKNLLESVSVGAVFLDTELKIVSFTEDVKPIVNLISTDIGRPVRDIATRLVEGNIADDARKVLESLQTIEKEVQVESGQWYLMRVRPYRSSEKIIGGVVITLHDISALKKAADEAIEMEGIKVARDFAQATIDTVKQPLVTLSSDFRIVTGNRAFYRLLKLKKPATEGELIYDVAKEQLNNAEFRRLLEQILPENIFIEDYPLTLGDGQKIRLNGRTVMTSAGIRLPYILIGIEEMGS